MAGICFWEAILKSLEEALCLIFNTVGIHKVFGSYLMRRCKEPSNLSETSFSFLRGGRKAA